MSKMRKALRSPWMTAFLFVVAAALLLTGGIGGTRAALQFYSDTYTSGVEMYDIGVSLVENGTAVSWRNYIPGSNGAWNETTGTLLSKMLAEGESLKLGYAYPEALSAQNSGTIDEYVRVTVYTYWERNGVKDTSLDPGLIDLHLVNTTETGGPWYVDRSATTETNERTVLYYRGILASGATAVPFSDTVTVSGDIASQVKSTTTERTETRDGHPCRVVTTTYDLDGVRFILEATVDAVQTHNAAAAIRSAWGVDPALLGVNG